MRPRTSRLLTDRVEAALALGEGEAGTAGRLMSLLFTVSAALVLLKSAQNSIFLTAYPREMIPFAFIASAFALALVSLATVPLAAKLGAPRLAVAMLAACATAMVLLRALLESSLKAAPFVSYVVIEAASGVMLMQTWGIVSQAAHARSAKRLLPAAGAGATLGWTVVGLLVPPMARALGTSSLLIVASVLLFGALFLVRAVISRDLSEATPHARKVAVFQEWQRAVEFIRELPLLRIMTALSMLALVTEQLMDYLLMSAARERYLTDAACAAFFGRYYALTSAVTLVLVVGLSSRVLVALGTVRALLLTPLVTAIAVIAVVALPGFGTVVILRGVDRVFKQSIWSSASEQTQLPIPPLERTQSRALVRGVLAPIGYALAAACLALLQHAGDVRWLALAIAAGVSAMAVLCLRSVRPAYQHALARALDARTFDWNDEAPMSFDADARQTLGRELSSHDEVRALLAAELLCAGAVAPPAAVVRAAMRSDLASVRASVIDAAARHSVSGLEDLFASVLTTDPSPACRLSAAKGIVALGLNSAPIREAIAVSITLETTGCVKAAARVASASVRDRAGVVGGAALAPLIASGDAALALAALEALGPRCATNDAVVTAIDGLLASDAHPPAKLAAVDAAARLNLVALLPSVVRLLEVPEIGPEVANRLVAWGGEAMAFVEGAFESASAASVRYVASALTGADRTSPLLVRLLSHSAPEVRERALRTLSYSVATRSLALPPGVEIELLLGAEIAIARSLTLMLAGLAQDDGSPDWKIDPPYDRLGREIELEVHGARRRVMYLLSLVGNHALAGAVETGLRSQDADATAKIAELVDASLPRALARAVVPLFERVSLRERAGAGGAALELRDPLRAIVDLGDAVLVGFAILAYGLRFRQRFPDVYDREAHLIPVFERMAFLRSVPLFEQMLGYELRAVAEMLSVVSLRAGETLFEKGDPGRDLYVVRSGRVSIRDGALQLAVAAEYEFFGELAVLDSEPRMASAVALEPCSLLRLGGTDFRELMARRPQIQERILQVLVSRLRQATGRIPKSS